MILGYLCSCGSILGYFVAGSWPGVVCWSACAPGYRAVHGRRLRLFRPRSYTAKMQWRKAVDRHPDPHRQIRELIPASRTNAVPIWRVGCILAARL